MVIGILIMIILFLFSFAGYKKVKCLFQNISVQFQILKQEKLTSSSHSATGVVGIVFPVQEAGCNSQIQGFMSDLESPQVKSFVLIKIWSSNIVSDCSTRIEEDAFSLLQAVIRFISSTKYFLKMAALAGKDTGSRNNTNN